MPKTREIGREKKNILENRINIKFQIPPFNGVGFPLRIIQRQRLYKRKKRTKMPILQ